jgi:hypothetical protein
MSQTLVLEVSDEVYSALRSHAEALGAGPSQGKWRDSYPGGQRKLRPPSRCMCRCGTVWPAGSLQLITIR